MNQNNLYRNDKFGCLYNFNTVTDKRDITSGNGWRVPTDADWKKVMKNKNFVKTLKENLGGLSWSGSFNSVAGYGNWWSATEYDSTFAWYRHLHYSLASVCCYGINKAYGFSVRCLKDIDSISQFDNFYIGNNRKKYKTIKIGDQIWLAENLCETKFRNGDEIEFSNVKQKEIMNELKIEKEKVLKAASECPQAKEILKTLFPEAFEEDKYFDLLKLTNGEASIFDNTKSKEAGFSDYYFMQIRAAYEYNGKGFYLSKEYNWEIIKDKYNHLVLLPTKKQ